MRLKPCKRNILVKFIQPTESAIITAAASRLNATAEQGQRTRVKVIEPSSEVAAEFPPDTFLLLRPAPAILCISEADGLGLIDASVVEAIVLDDTDEA